MKKYYSKIIQLILSKLSKNVLEKFSPYIIVVTGSVGKSATKDAIYAVLSDNFGTKNVIKSSGNLNSEIGLPLSVLMYTATPNVFVWPFFLIGAYIRTKTIRHYPKYLILEMGVDKPGDISYFGKFIQPDIAVITSLGGAHLGNFSCLEQYQAEKVSVQKILKTDSKTFVNIDDEQLAQLPGDKISVSIDNPDSNYQAEDISLSFLGMSYRIKSRGQKIAVKTKVFGGHLIYAQLFAFAIGQFLEIGSLSIAKSLEKLESNIGRMKIIEGKNNMIILDDTYNSNLVSAKAAIDSIQEIEYSGRKVLIFGNMNELGSHDKSFHEIIAKYARDKFGLVIFAGKNAENMKKSYGKGGCYSFANREDIIENGLKLLKPRDLVLIKASQNGNFFEEITKVLMSNPEKASELLVRQSKAWLKKKNVKSKI